MTEKPKYTLLKKNDATYELRTEEGTLVAYVNNRLTSVSVEHGWWVNPQTSARRPQRTLRATPYAAVHDFYSRAIILDPTTTVPCTGEAHKNPFIDNCGVCMPEWADITVCVDCGHRPKQHGPKGCHGQTGDFTKRGAANNVERCKCIRTFATQGGVRRLKKIAVTVDYGWHGDRKQKGTETATYEAINTTDALAQSRAVFRERYLSHLTGCTDPECYMSGSQSAPNHSNGFIFAREDVQPAETVQKDSLAHV